VSGRAELGNREPSMNIPSVDLVVNSYERTYRSVLEPGFFPRIVAQNQRPFAQRVALINNVTDRSEAEDRAKRLTRDGELDAYHFVEDLLVDALKTTGLAKEDLGRVPHYSDCALVAVTLQGSPYLVYWDAEVQLRETVNWIDESIELMESDSRILVANPNWQAPTLEREMKSSRGNFAFGYGFSDQLFLVRRERLARPIYDSHCLASLRNPFAHVAGIFEQRVDSYMRANRLLRATYVPATYEHLEKDGSAYAPIGWRERGRYIRNRALVAVLKRLPTTNPCFKI
jgi:hypothetical protein